MSLRVYIGYDIREPETYRVAERSLRRNASIPVEVTPLSSARLAESGLLRRPTDLRGQRYDIHSNAPASTEFAISRFLVPILAQTGWALFCDSDVVFLGDVAELLSVADDRYAVQCRKAPRATRPLHKDGWSGQPAVLEEELVFGDAVQRDHPANRRLSLNDVQERPGRYLHSFGWLHDSEIGDLPSHWNWLVTLQPKPEKPRLAHFTLGTPELGVKSDHDDIWYAEAS
jgi:hypothetical protein